MKRKLSLCVLLGAAFALTGCNLTSFLGGENAEGSSGALSIASLLDPFGFFQKTDSTNTNTNNPTSNNTINTETDSLLDTLKAMAKPIAAKMLGKSESSIVFGDSNDESAEADVYYYDSSTLTFICCSDYVEEYKTSVVNTLISYLPSGATLSRNEDDLSGLEEYGETYYDRYYTLGNYTYNIYVEAFQEDEEEGYPEETYSYVFIYKTSQESQFIEFMSEE